MPALSIVAATAFLLTLGSILYACFHDPGHNQIIADIERLARQYHPIRNTGVVVAEPANGDGIWTASVHWVVDGRDVVQQAYATTEAEALIRLRRLVRRELRVAGLAGVGARSSS